MAGLGVQPLSFDWPELDLSTMKETHTQGPFHFENEQHMRSTLSPVVACSFWSLGLGLSDGAQDYPATLWEVCGSPPPKARSPTASSPSPRGAADIRGNRIACLTLLVLHVFFPPMSPRGAADVGKGQMRSALMASLRIVMFFDIVFWVLPLAYFLSSQNARAHLFPQICLSSLLQCSGPVGVDPTRPQPRRTALRPRAPAGLTRPGPPGGSLASMLQNRLRIVSIRLLHKFGPSCYLNPCW